MSKFRKIYCSIWNDANFRSMSANAQLVYFFVCTHPHMTAVGAMRATISGMAEELGWTVESFRESFLESVSNGFLEHDASACFVGIPNSLESNAPHNTNVFVSWAPCMSLLPDCSLKVVLYQRLKSFAECRGDGWVNAFENAFGNHSPNKEMYMEMYMEMEQERENGASEKPSCSSSGESKKKPKGKEKPPYDPHTDNLPESLDDERFRRKWIQWCEYRERVKKEPVTAASATRSLKQLQRIPVADAISEIDNAMRRQWRGCAFSENIKRILEEAKPPEPSARLTPITEEETCGTT